MASIKTLSHFIFLLLFASTLFGSAAAEARNEPVHPERFTAMEDAIRHAQTKLRQTMLELSFNTSLHPGHTDPFSGRWDQQYLSRSEWTSGFFSGSLWYMYKLTGDPEWKNHAIAWTEDLEPAAGITFDHDTGFRIFSSFGNGYKLTESRPYYRVILNAAQTLSRRYNPQIGAIKSWDWIGSFPVIIDNLMNLEILFWAAEQSGNRTFYNMALSHAETSLAHHLRPDGSTYHVVDFDYAGNINWKDTRQGYNAHSVWTRGQAWAMYGFTMIHRFTREPRFLEAAMAASDYFLENLSEDFVPVYDFMEPYGSVRTKDASAAAIAASALFELYTFTHNTRYFNAAVRILESLATEEYSTINGDKNSILTKSTLHRGFGNVGTSYADYYYLEAIVRYQELSGPQFPRLSTIPSLYLDQNYPNPFNSSTVIHYSINEPGFAELGIYDAMGRAVTRLTGRHHEAGNYRLAFDATGLSSGTYFYVLRTGGNVITRKMVFLK